MVVFNCNDEYSSDEWCGRYISVFWKLIQGPADHNKIKDSPLLSAFCSMCVSKNPNVGMNAARHPLLTSSSRTLASGPPRAVSTKQAARKRLPVLILPGFLSNNTTSPSSQYTELAQSLLALEHPAAGAAPGVRSTGCAGNCSLTQLCNCRDPPCHHLGLGPDAIRWASKQASAAPDRHRPHTITKLIAICLRRRLVSVVPAAPGSSRQ